LVAAIAGLVASLLAGLFICATNAGMYVWAMERAGVYETAGVDGETLTAVAGDVARYIGARVPADFDRVIVMDGLERPALNERELTHMKDVRQLLKLAGNVAGWFCAACAIAVVITARMKARRAAGLGMMAGAGVMLICALAVLIAIRVSFYNFFVALHERLFANDLWYMNPETDLLIRMMPDDFYISMGAAIGAAWAVVVIATCAAGLLLIITDGRREARRAV
jgi:integral membrane protein (TIGR01906 family)